MTLHSGKLDTAQQFKNGENKNIWKRYWTVHSDSIWGGSTIIILRLLRAQYEIK